MSKHTYIKPFRELFELEGMHNLNFLDQFIFAKREEESW